MEHRTPHPGIRLHQSQSNKPHPQAILAPNPPADLAQTDEIDIEVTQGQEDRDGFLNGSEAVEGPFAVDWVLAELTLSRGSSRY